MTRLNMGNWLLGSALLFTVLLSAGGYRYYRIVPHLRFENIDMVWQLLPLVPVITALVGFKLRQISRPVPAAPTTRAPHS